MPNELVDPKKMGEAFRYCADIVRQNDKDRFLTSLFAPAEERVFLFALYAFDIETAKVRELVSDPMVGNIRLQWWHEAMAGLRPDEADSHPVLTALMCAVDLAAGGDRSLLTRVVEARQAELFGASGVDAAAAVLLMAVRFLGTQGDGSSVAQDAATALTFAGDPAKYDEAREAYLSFRAASRGIPPSAKPAFLPVALVPLRMKQPSPPQWRKQLVLMRAAWLGFPLL